MKKLMIVKFISSSLIVLRHGILLYKTIKGEICPSTVLEQIEQTSTEKDFSTTVLPWIEDQCADVPDSE